MIYTATIRDFYQKILGYIETDSSTGIKTARNFYKKKLGTYNPNENKTRDFYGRIIGSGDLLGMLISQDQSN